MGKAAPPEQYEGFRVVTAAEMAAVDRAAIEEHGVPADVLMENAGTAVAQALLGVVPGLKRVVVVCGKGNNGGDGLVCARVLAARGVEVSVFVLAPTGGKAYSPEVAANLKRAEDAGLSAAFLEKDVAALEAALGGADLLVDALLGTGSAGKPAGTLKKAIQAMMKSGKPIAAIDVPSGIHPDSGYHAGVFVRAKWTYTLGLPKRGLVVPHAAPNVGELRVLDIGFPPEVLR